MKKPNPKTLSEEVNPEELGAQYWYERYGEQRAETENLKKRVSELEETIENLSEKLRKLTQRSSQNSSQPPSSDGYKKPSRLKKKPGRKRGPKYNHPGKTRNGFGYIDEKVVLEVSQCPNCGGELEVQEGKVKRQQVVELVPKLVEVKEYERPVYECLECRWQGQADLPMACQEGFSYGGRLSSLVGWLGYGGNLSWSKQRYLVESLLGVPLSQGSLCKMHSWFAKALQPAYEKWRQWIQKPGVRCVDETSYRVNGVNHWMWVATASEYCVLFFAPTRSSAEVKKLLGEDFSGILSSDCWSAYSPQSAAAKQKCLAHIERKLKELKGSRWSANRHFAQQVFPILQQGRQAHRDYHLGQLSLEALQEMRPQLEEDLRKVLDHPPKGGWAADAQTLGNRFRRHESEWFTFMSYPQVIRNPVVKATL